MADTSKAQPASSETETQSFPPPPPAPIPITILTGFLGAGKTTLLLNLLPQLPPPPTTRLCIIKNEFGSVAVDSKLLANNTPSESTPSNETTTSNTSTDATTTTTSSSSSPIAGVQELLNGCICCNLVGQLSPALAELTATYQPTRIIIETSGSAFPATLALEILRLSHPYPNDPTRQLYFLDGVIMVVDVENWKGYEDKGYTAKMQARFTDLVVLNKWEEAGERRVDECVDWIREVGEDTAVVKSQRGWVAREVVFGVEGGGEGEGVGVGGVGKSRVAKIVQGEGEVVGGDEHEHKHAHAHDHDREHSNEVDVLSVTLTSTSTSINPNPVLDLEKFLPLLKKAPKDEIYRLKAIVRASRAPPAPPGTPAANSTSNPTTTDTAPHGVKQYILNWAFGRWTFTPLPESGGEGGGVESGSAGAPTAVLEMTAVLARGEAGMWKRKFERLGYFGVEGAEGGEEPVLSVEKVVSSA